VISLAGSRRNEGGGSLGKQAASAIDQRQEHLALGRLDHDRDVVDSVAGPLAKPSSGALRRAVAWSLGPHRQHTGPRTASLFGLLVALGKDLRQQPEAQTPPRAFA
jgi:hypothetical protein